MPSYDDEDIFAGGLADRAYSLRNMPISESPEQAEKDRYDILTRLAGSVPGIPSDIFNLARDADYYLAKKASEMTPEEKRLSPFSNIGLMQYSSQAPQEETTPFEDRFATTEYFQKQMGGDPQNPISIIGDVLSMVTQPEVVALKALPFIAGISKAKKGIESLEAAKKSTQGIGALEETKRMLQEQVNTLARNENFVSPSISAMIKAPRNLKGQGILEYLNKNAKPKELEYLGINDYIARNPNATMDDVIKHASDNQVRINKHIIQDNQAPLLEFRTSTPDTDPLDGSDLWAGGTEDLVYGLTRQSRQAEIKEELLKHYNNAYSSDTFDRRINKELPVKVESFDDIPADMVDEVIDDYAKAQYYENPYELIEPDLPDMGNTFAFGNEEVGYQLFINGERVTDTNNVPYSATEAQIQLRNAMEENMGTDPFRLAGEEDFPSEAQYKQYVDKTLPGGDNYREIVFEWENAPMTHRETDHFDSETAIAHALARDRKLADGTDSLHIDELQSDLHSEGSKSGYQLADDVAARTANEIDDFLKDTPYSFHVKDGTTGIVLMPEDRFTSMADLRYADPEGHNMAIGKNTSKLLEDLGEEKIIELVKKAKPFMEEGRIPNYPYKDDWHKLGLKQMLLEAIENGKDALSVSGSLPIKNRYSEQYSTFYETLYDKKIPSEMKKLANKYGGTFEKGRLEVDDVFPTWRAEIGDTGDELRQLDTNILKITPEMKQKILAEGVESFKGGGLVQDIDIFAE